MGLRDGCGEVLFLNKLWSFLFCLEYAFIQSCFLGECSRGFWHVKGMERLINLFIAMDVLILKAPSHSWMQVKSIELSFILVFLGMLSFNSPGIAIRFC